ncbi:hypothetical protein OS493_018904, partial [Desmophyllum pertusum]
AVALDDNFSRGDVVFWMGSIQHLHSLLSPKSAFPLTIDSNPRARRRLQDVRRRKKKDLVANFKAHQMPLRLLEHRDS